MELSTFVPRTTDTMGDKLPATDAVDRPLIVLVREHRTGIKTQFNSNPNKEGYKPEGGDGVTVDVADVRTNEVWIDVLWMNAAVVDNLAPYIAQPVAVKLAWQASSKAGGKRFITVVPLDGQELSLAHQWALANPDRFETERTKRAQETTTAAATAPATTTPATSTPGSSATPESGTGTVPDHDTAVLLQDPQIAALFAQIQAQKAQAS